MWSKRSMQKTAPAREALPQEGRRLCTPSDQTKEPGAIHGAGAVAVPPKKRHTPRTMRNNKRGVPDDDLLSRARRPTIIGAESFHGPVRDGKGWCQLAMVVRHDLLPDSAHARGCPTNSEAFRSKKYSVSVRVHSMRG